MTSIVVALYATLVLGGAPAELPRPPSGPPAPPPGLGASSPIERRPAPPRRGKATIKGWIVARGEPVAHVQVSAPEYRLGDLSNEDGSFTLTNVPTGACTLQIRGLGYCHATRAIEVADPGIDSLTISIDPVSWPVPSCTPWFEVDPRQGDSEHMRVVPCGSGGGYATVSRGWGRLTISETGPACDLSVHWMEGRGTARVTVRDSSGTVIRTLFDSAASRSSARGGLLSWDGVRDDGAVATAGTYRVRLEGRGKHLELVTRLWPSRRLPMP